MLIEIDHKFSMTMLPNPPFKSQGESTGSIWVKEQPEPGLYNGMDEIKNGKCYIILSL